MASVTALREAVRTENREKAKTAARDLYEDGFDFIDSDGRSTVWVQVGGLTIGVEAEATDDSITVARVGSGVYETPDGELMEDIPVPIEANPDAYRAIHDEVESWT